ncbi:MAG: hypothetical protein ACT6S0_13555 [Roseateles sp.]|uniref:hypothetical protein n=1 Tax=Roseateles sp. TaxID=1971397 RepID=UPI00403736F6
MKIRATAYCLLTAAMTGCTPLIETNGQVFIDSSGSARKLAQVEIYVVPEDTLVKNLKAAMPAMASEFTRLKADHDSSKQSLAQAMGHAQQAQMLATASRISTSQMPNAGLASSAVETVQAATKSLKAANERAREAKDAVVGLATGRNAAFYVPQATQGNSIVTTSDADGKFKLSLVSGKRVAIVARKDDLSWFVYVTPNKGEQILLTEKNLNGTGCDACVFTRDQLTGPLAFIPATFKEAVVK